MMRIEFNAISVTPREYTVDEYSWLPDEETVTVQRSSAHYRVTRIDEKTVELEGELCLDVELACDRCGELFQEELVNQFTYVVKNEADISLEEQDIELLEEEINTVYLQESTLDISEILREQFYLTIPESRICKKDCRGLCFNCGSPLTSETCTCQPDLSGSPFAVLQKLKK